MSNIKKLKPKPHIVIVDTNVLWHEDKCNVVQPAFDSFWDNHSKEFELALYVPDVVEGELIFQQTTSATKSMRTVTDAMERISSITDSKYTHRITERQIRERVATRFRRWLQRRGGKIVETPIGDIDWANMIRRAVWREPPFEFDPNKPDREKGFRDGLILETVIHICTRDNAPGKIAFLCGDNLLRNTAKASLASDPRFSCFESLEDFESYLKLTKEKLQDQFVKSLLRRATEKFYVEKNPKCLYLAEGIRGKLQTGFKKYFDDPEESDPLTFKSRIGSLSTESWQPTDAAMFWISNARFARIEESNEYHWLTIVTFVKQYRRVGYLSSLLSPGFEIDRALILPFHIAWRARVSADGRFSRLQTENIELKGNMFVEPTNEQRKFWRLKSRESLKPVVLRVSPSGAEES